ncbi:hypothetical protein LBMAG53_36870 [Planctomycetota bacterium]|nr:hypothetical protein LBMAG53_36870 [Planctomycetota bacterium]
MAALGGSRRGATLSTVRLRPTGHALSFATACTLLVAAAVSYQSNAAWLVAQLVACAGLASAVFSARNLHGLSVQVGEVAAVEAGRTALVPVTLFLAGRRPVQALLITVEVQGLESQPIWLPTLDPGRSQVVVPVPTTSAGLFTVRAALLRSVWPLGLAEAGLDLDRPGQRIAVVPVPVPAAMPGTTAGDDRDFAGHRPWRQGMAPSAVDWRAAARRPTGAELPAKSFAAVGGASELRYADAVAAAGAGADEERRLGVLAYWIDQAEQHGADYALILPSAALPAGRGSVHREACRLALATAASRGAAA